MNEPPTSAKNSDKSESPLVGLAGVMAESSICGLRCA